MRALFLKIKIDCQDIKKQNILRRKNVILSALYHVKVLDYKDWLLGCWYVHLYM